MELIGSAVWQALHAAGLQVLPVAADLVDILTQQLADTTGDATHAGNTKPADPPRNGNSAEKVRLRVLARGYPVSASDLREMAKGFRSPAPALVVVPTATPAARAAAVRLGWSLIATNPRSLQGPQGQVLLPSGRSVPVGASDQGSVADGAAAKPGRVPWGTLTVLRRLAGGAEGTQSQLAELAGVTQARVSQALKELSRAGLVSSWHGQPTRYAAKDWDRVVRHWLAAYPGPGGISTYWYGLDDRAEQARAVVALLREQPVGHPVPQAARDVDAAADSGPLDPAAVVSGDVAADQVAPWRRPQRAVIYAHRGADLAEVGLTPATEQDATLELIVPRDRGVWPVPASQHVWAWPGTPELPLADPLQILWDVRRAPGPDRDQAAERLLAALRALASGHSAQHTSGSKPAGGDGR